MQAVALKPQRIQITLLTVELLLLSVLAIAMPPAAAAVAFLLPLAGCPLQGQSRRPLAWIACIVPVISWVCAGYDLVTGLCLLLPYALCGGLFVFFKANKTLASPLLVFACVGAYAISLTALAAAAAHALGTSLPTGLTRLASKAVQSTKQPGLTLYRLAAFGLVNLPKGVENTNLLLLLFDPVLTRQMLLSFELTLEMLLKSLLPALFVHITLIGGLFTAFRTQRLNCAMLVVDAAEGSQAERKTHVALPPGFRLLTIPSHARNALFLCGLAGMLLLFTGGAYVQTLGVLLYTVFNAIFELTGAAVMVCVLAARHPERRVLYGIMAALLYVLFPLALFLLGVTDQLLHFRSTIIHVHQNHQEEEKP